MPARPPASVQSCRPAAFLDRDGVVNVDHGYTYRPDELELTPTAAEAVSRLNQAGYRVIIVSNQSGVARGYYGLAEVDVFHAHLNQTLAQTGGHIDAFYVCPYHPDGSVEPFAIEHEDRKPGAGMIRRALRDWNVSIEGSFLIGDKQSDLDSALAAGIPARLIESNVGDLSAAVTDMLARVGHDPC